MRIAFVFLGLILIYPLHLQADIPNSSTQTATSTQTSDDLEETSSISSNPAAVNVGTGSGFVQRWFERQLGIKDNHGISIQGAWIADTNGLFSGGIPGAKTLTSNSVELVDLTVETERLYGWKGGLFSIQFLQQNAQNTNGLAGVIQGYNSLPDIPPFNRSELYALWYRQSLVNDMLFLKIGKTITTLDFNNVVKPVQLGKDRPNIPAVTSLIYSCCRLMCS